ncbi:hypothetical protein [uncultured Tateyamaria sp.]|uniref:hypothetical protein n=1 Tax=uncultured Tateyamaria sp. TaxID=455651 RepID=UPI002617CBB7|nr:hypothetical protein [uncultured Tateyamaria sp.]
MTDRTYKRKKRGTGRHVQLSEALQSTEAWATLKPGPRALYVELKRRYRGNNNGRLVLSHRDAAKALSVHRNTVGAWFTELERRGLIYMVRGAFLGPSGVGEAPHWALAELPTADGQSANWAFRSWRENQKPVTENRTRRHRDCDGHAVSAGSENFGVLKIVT